MYKNMNHGNLLIFVRKSGDKIQGFHGKGQNI